MSTEPLDLDTLARFCNELAIEDSYVHPYLSGNEEASIHIGGYIGDEYVGVGTKDYVPIDRAEKLVSLLTALPRLIELARIGQQVGMLEDGEEIAIIKPPQEAERWAIEVDDI